MKIQRLTLFILIACSTNLIPLQSWGQLNSNRVSLESASQGLPQVAEYLSEDSFVEVKAKRLKEAQVLWVNHDLLNEMGIDIPAQGVTQEFEEKILDAFAYVVPRENDSPRDFLEQEKIFYADRYGGLGIGSALGSGRAAGAGMFQLKGLGRTALADTEKSPDLEIKKNFFSFVGIFQRIWDKFVEDNHSHGGATLREAMSEAVWGELLHQELPYGANRVAVIIGTKQSIGLARNPRALIIRQNSLRPAHYIRNGNRPEEEADIETERIEKLIEPFSQLPIIADAKGGVGQKLNLVVKEIFERVGKKYGTEYAHSIFHGSSSPSNIELTGRAIDHGPLTALDGFTRALNVDDYPNGDVKLLLFNILYDLVDDLRAIVGKKYRNSIPSKNELRQIVTLAYDRQIRKELLWRYGLPIEIAKQMMNTTAGQEFAEEIFKIAQIGNEKIVSTKTNVPLKTGKYDMNLILKNLATIQPEKEREEKMLGLISEKSIRSSLLKKHLAFQSELEQISQTNGLEKEMLAKYAEIASAQRNQTFRELMRGGIMYVRQYLHMIVWTLTRSTGSIRSYVETMTKKYGRNKEVFKEADLVLKEKKDQKTGSLLRQVLDTQAGKRKIEIVTYESEGVLQFFDSRFNSDEVRQGLQVHAGKQDFVLDRVYRVGNKVILDIFTESENLNQFQQIKISASAARAAAQSMMAAPMCSRILFRASGR